MPISYWPVTIKTLGVHKLLLTFVFNPLKLGMMLLSLFNRIIVVVSLILFIGVAAEIGYLLLLKSQPVPPVIKSQQATLKTPPQNYIDNLVQKNKPFLFSTQVIYRGTLVEISDKNIVLSDDYLKPINIPLTPEINKLLTYSKLLGQQTSVPANKSEFTSGQMVYVTLSIDSGSNKIMDFNIRIDSRK